MPMPVYRPLLVLATAGLLMAAASGCSDGTSATATTASPPPPPSTASPKPSPSPTLSAQQAASRAAYNAYVSMLADTDAVIQSSRDDNDPRLQRHATSSGFSLVSRTVDYYVQNGWGTSGGYKIPTWKPVSFYPRTGKPYALTAGACLDSRDKRDYDLKTGKVAPPLTGHQRVPVVVRAQIDHGRWVIVYLRPAPEKTC